MNIKSVRVLVLGCVLAAPGVGLAGTVDRSVAQALPGAQAASVTVNFKDLDLDTAAGAEMLYQRIAAAAKQVCPQMNSADLRDFRSVRDCRRRVIAQTVERVHSPRLEMVSAGHGAPIARGV